MLEVNGGPVDESQNMFPDLASAARPALRKGHAMNELRFDDKVVIVTGSGRGFGRAHAMTLAARGAKVVVADYGVNVDGTGSSPEPAQLVAKEIEAAGGVAVPCFASSPTRTAPTPSSRRRSTPSVGSTLWSTMRESAIRTGSTR